MDTNELNYKVEALLFSSGKKMTLNEISALTRSKPDLIKEALNNLKKDYESKESSLMIIQEGDFWKIAVKEKHLELVRKIVTQTELSKTVIETLAIIAWKAPCLQSVIIKIRTNKAYDHIKELEKDGYITRTKQGRTMLIRLAQKFYDYFDIPQDKVKEVFSRFHSLEKQIQEKEQEADDAIEKIRKIEAEHKKQRAAMEKMEATGIDLLDEEDNLTEQEKIAKDLIKQERKEHRAELINAAVKESRGQKEKIGNLEVVEESREELITEAAEKSGINEDISLEDAEERADRDLPEPIEKRVNKRVKEIVPEHPILEPAEESTEEETPEKEELQSESGIEGQKKESKKEKKEREKEKEQQAKAEIEEEIDKKVEEMINPEKKE